jgi:hypothetical protein
VFTSDKLKLLVNSAQLEGLAQCVRKRSAMPATAMDACCRIYLGAPAELIYVSRALLFLYDSFLSLQNLLGMTLLLLLHSG